MLADLFPQAPIFTLLYDPAKFGARLKGHPIETSFLQKLPKFLRQRPRYLLPLYPTAIESFDFSEFDLVISSSSAFALGLIPPLKTRHLCYCHSPARFLWDYAHRFLQENQITGLKKFLASSLTKNLRIWNYLAAQRVEHFLANSQVVQARIRKYFRQPATVIYPPVEMSDLTVTPQHKNYFLIVSRLTSYKKIDLALAVFNKLRRRLVIVGAGREKEKLQKLAGPTIEFRGEVSRATLVTLLQNCRGLIFPGEDDFGITPVEAMACGKPVLALGRGGALETVVHGKTGIFFPEPTAASLENGLAELFRLEEKFQPTQIRKHAEKFQRKIFEQKIKKAVAAIFSAQH